MNEHLPPCCVRTHDVMARVRLTLPAFDRVQRLTACCLACNRPLSVTVIYERPEPRNAG